MQFYLSLGPIPWPSDRAREIGSRYPGSHDEASLIDGAHEIPGRYTDARSAYQTLLISPVEPILLVCGPSLLSSIWNVVR